MFQSEQAPPCHFFSKDTFFNALISNLLDPKILQNSEQKTAHIFLLAHLSCVNHNSKYPSDLMAAKRLQTMQAIENLYELFQDKMLTVRIFSKLDKLEENLDLPIVSAFLLKWIHGVILDPNYHEASYHATCSPVLFHLLCKISSLHILLRPDVLTLLSDLYALPTSLDAQAGINLHRQVLRCLLSLVHVGEFESVFGWIHSVLPRIDHSLVRFFVTNLLGSISGPYSPEYSKQLLKLLSTEGIDKALVGHVDIQQQVSGLIKSLENQTNPSVHDQLAIYSDFLQKVSVKT
jgi:negative elongation factor C/D